MSKRVWGILGVSLFVFSGCVENRFPQYTGDYTLTGARYYRAGVETDPWANADKPPTNLRLTHRMEWTGNYWRQVLRFDSHDTGGVKGFFSSDLSALTRVGPGCGAGSSHCDWSGTSFRPDSGTPSQAGAFCTFHGYEYLAFIHPEKLYPRPELLQKIYWSSEGPKLPGVQAAKADQGSLMLTDPANAKVDPRFTEEWIREAVDAGGFGFELRLAKRANGGYSGCGEAGMPPSATDTDLGEIVLNYHMDFVLNEDDVDLRSAGLGSAGEPSQQPNLFESITGYAE